MTNRYLKEEYELERQLIFAKTNKEYFKYFFLWIKYSLIKRKGKRWY